MTKPKKPSQKQGNPKNKPLMCKSYRGFGRFSLAAGLIFLAAAFVLGFNSTRISVAAFFLVLGAVDLIFYSRYGEHS